MSARATGSTIHGGERAGTLTARVIADLVKGELRGDPDTEVAGVAPLGSATEGQISFLSDGRYSAALAGSSAGIVL
ncbi:MAG: LpxD N-terminal domain-containing protein, partial [Gemmatimonadales bacterium]